MKFNIEFIVQGQNPKKFELDTNALPSGGIGNHHSVLDIATGLDIDIDHACGGVCDCSTCHIYVKQGLESCNEATEEEEDQLDEAPNVKPNSRLACQCIPNGTKDLVIEIPNWNRNLAREGR
jgi:2Fe-2S ferredoxin